MWTIDEGSATESGDTADEFSPTDEIVELMFVSCESIVTSVVASGYACNLAVAGGYAWVHFETTADNLLRLSLDGCVYGAW